ncbi:class I tRNA ligase family protein, partial [Klebsiella quasivariicola]|uniref:class I tRNA ligase family protein n=2 Tax=Gammaproteobacteria TaxID=1236 RepID=UPI002B05CB91
LFAGQHVFKANASVIEVLTERGALLHHKVFNHSYPHCWRHKTPIIFRATPQWFISMEQKGLRKRALEEIERIEKDGIAQQGQSGWVPAWGKNRIQAMVENRPD